MTLQDAVRKSSVSGRPFKRPSNTFYLSIGLNGIICVVGDGKQISFYAESLCATDWQLMQDEDFKSLNDAEIWMQKILAGDVV